MGFDSVTYTSLTDTAADKQLTGLNQNGTWLTQSTESQQSVVVAYDNIQ